MQQNDLILSIKVKENNYLHLRRQVDEKERRAR